MRQLFQRTTLLWATPLVGMLFFIAAMGAFLFLMQKQDEQQTHETVIRDVELSRQTMRARLQTTQDRISQLAREVGQETVDDIGFTRRAREILSETPEVLQVGMMDGERYARWTLSSTRQLVPDLHVADERIEDAESYWAFVTARDSLRPAYSRPYIGPNSEIFIELHAPVLNGKNQFSGTVFAGFPMNALLNETLPLDFQSRYLFSIIDGGGNPVATNGGRSLERAVDAYEVPLDPPGQGLKLRAIALKSQNQLMQNMLAWVVVGLSIVIVWSFLLLMRHAYARARAEARLSAEAEFRRAMEDSVSTGLRVFDLQGRITYMNPAFSKMTGFSELDLVGTRAPFPYWPKDQIQEQQRNLDMLLSGMAPPNGIELKMQRKNGELFDARMYVSPLISSSGQQTGWMTSITDITEPKRTREELASAHERFTTVLEELDAAISVSAPTGKGVRDLLFANRLHRKWFEHCLTDGALGISTLAQSTAPGVFECYWKEQGRWFEVRRRTITWVDGRWVSMDVTTDITERKKASEMAKSQQEKLQFTSRLVTMGEMASLLAHELNQPLAAISNYSMGSVARIKSGRAELADILPALEKATQQAQRAGNVIRRIREFVKRKAPDRKACQLEKIIEDAVSFAEIDAKTRGIEIQMEMPETPSPAVYADRILIEQVILNLIKNGMDAMVGTEASQRRIVVTVTEQAKALNLSVADFGSGIPDEALEKLFEPFFSTKPEGMGMGLNICRSIVEYHESTLDILKNTPTGTIFKFSLPLYQPDIHTSPEENLHELPHPITISGT
jgi:PAS domain S-box-containing protein